VDQFRWGGSNVKDKKAKSSKSNYQSLLNVQFDWNAIKAHAVSSADIQKVIEKLNELASEIAYMKVETAPKYEKEIDKFNEEVTKEFNKQSKKFYKSKEAAHKKHYKIKGGKPIEALDPESIRIYLYENNFTELFDNLGILGEYTFESANLFGAASDVVAKRRSKSMEIKLPRLMKMIRHLIVLCEVRFQPEL
jgi:hypothetical protein